MVSVNDIFNRPPTISEDALQYTLYLPPDQSDRVSATALAALLTEHAQSLLPGHLWHRDAFELKVAPDPEGNKDVWVLEGHMRVGDCIDDEWCVVWLLRELSSKWDVVASVFDSDGEFLLIEAAEELPSWVTPTNAENRVWIHNSRLHLIPLSHVSPPSSKSRRRKYIPRGESDEEDNMENDEDSDFITAADAVRLVRDPLVDTAAPNNVQDVVWKRISGYPAASRQHMHNTKAYLPVDVAKALALNPLLVQKAVETFYTRDALQLRAAQKMTRFPPEPAVLSSVKMTRTAYAQLVGQKFHPPKVFGRWTEREGTKEWRWRDVGMKIACGFEMLYQESKNRKESVSANFDGSPESLEAAKDGLRRNPEYTQYIQRLVSAGYFKGEREGSQLWTALENKAAAAFITVRRDDDASRPSFATTVQTAISQYSDAHQLLYDEEDPDDWLNIEPAGFDEMLEKTMGASKDNEAASDPMNVDPQETDEDRVARAQAERLRDLAKKVEQFVEGEGDLEGARFADEAFSDDSDDSDNTDADYPSGHEDDDVAMSDDAGTAEFTEEQRKARQEAMDRLVPAIAPSDYGKMPASFHGNSQRVTPVTVETEVRENVTTGTDDASTRSRPIRPPILPRDQFDGVDSDDETDEEDAAGDDEDEEDHPQVVGDIEIDMSEEGDEFIEFARQALGVTDEHWKSILDERKERGAFVPTHVVSENQQRKQPSPLDVRPQESAPMDSFEAVMKAMDAQLSQARNGQEAEASQNAGFEAKGKGKEKASDDVVDIEAAMEEELRSALEQDESETGDGDVQNAQSDYRLIKNFLESFKSQAGLSGPVSALAGRLQEGWTLPRDES
ncbi:SGT1-domain-containing protein [Polyporus arcularius HHB13444]|uniref:SGT1-domain-containing protein n=1 Tax=Polyporus arcularius HHB13444 TaxID=1314778 RepID=A0A5C3PLH2_9APHY|nr:SGT1-domain-containing protein [Polyporus arcularius HHB13444]